MTHLNAALILHDRTCFGCFLKLMSTLSYKLNIDNQILQIYTDLIVRFYFQFIVVYVVSWNFSL